MQRIMYFLFINMIFFIFIEFIIKPEVKVESKYRWVDTTYRSILIGEIVESNALHSTQRFFFNWATLAPVDDKKVVYSGYNWFTSLLILLLINFIVSIFFNIPKNE